MGADSKVQKPTLFLNGVAMMDTRDLNHSHNDIKDTNNIDNIYDNISHITALESFS